MGSYFIYSPLWTNELLIMFIQHYMSAVYLYQTQRGHISGHQQITNKCDIMIQNLNMCLTTTISWDLSDLSVYINCISSLIGLHSLCVHASLYLVTVALWIIFIKGNNFNIWNNFERQCGMCAFIMPLNYLHVLNMSNYCWLSTWVRVVRMLDIARQQHY